MTHWSCRIVLVCSFFLFSSVSQAQEPATAEQPEEKARPSTETKILGLIESIAERATNLRSQENRIRVTVTVANMLWPQNEKRARALFQTVTEEMSGIAASIRTDRQAAAKIPLFAELRSEVIEKLARRDPDLALEFLRLTRIPQPGSTARAYGMADFESNLEIHLANLIVPKDPARALSIARANLARGLSHEMNGLLSQLQQKDQASARAFYRDLVDKVNAEIPANNQEVSNFAVSLLASFRPPQMEEQPFAELIKTVSNAAVSHRAGESTYRVNYQENLASNLRHMMPDIEKYAPAAASRLRSMMERFDNTHLPHQKFQLEIQTVAQQGTVDDILALAPKYPVEMRDMVYQQAIWTSVSNGDAARARQIASELIADFGQRQSMLEQIDRNLMWNAVNDAKFVEAREMLRKFPSPEERAQFLIQLSRNVANKNDKQTACNLLDEAETVLNEAAPGSGHIQMQIELADAYATLDVGRSFTILTPLVSQLNELIAAAIVLDGFDNRYLKDGEWVTGAGSVGNLVNGVGEKLASLARIDFDRALALSNQVERPEVRLMIQLSIAQAVADDGNSICSGCVSSPLMHRTFHSAAPDGGL